MAEQPRARRRKASKKKSQQQQQQQQTKEAAGKEAQSGSVQVDYVAEEFDEGLAQAFGNVLERFGPKDPEAAAPKQEEKPPQENGDNEGEEQEPKVESRSARRRRLRLSIGVLKQMVNRPELVEDGDQNAQDPLLHHFLKSIRNTVPVPMHWREKRKYLHGKKGIAKPPFQLPSFIAATGIQKLRQAYAEKEEAKKLKQKQREKMQPKMGKMDIDYQVLHDAFFRYQTKPRLTRFGELYYEGKEFELQACGKPGKLSNALRAALGMSENSPLPWIRGLQKHGIPPSYPDMIIPGVNAPLPAGASYGVHQDGWGEPPTDLFGRPKYGGVLFGAPREVEKEQVDRTLWGDLVADEDDEEEEEEEEDEGEQEEGGEEAQQQQKEGREFVREAGADGFRSVESSVAVPEILEEIDLRKPQQDQQRKAEAHQVLEQKEQHVGANAIVGSAHTYVVPGAPKAKKDATAGSVEVALRPEELEKMDDAAISAKYEAANEAKRRPRENDFSDMVAEDAERKKRKRKDEQKKKFKF